MGIVVQTNVPSLIAQNSLTKASNAMNIAMERMTTGYKLNSAKDDAAGLYVATSLDKNIRGSEVAQKNVQMGNDMISVAEGDLAGIQDNLLRVRDLALTAANGIYDQESLDAIKAEVNARLKEIDRVAYASEYNGKKLLDGSTDTIALQVGANTDTVKDGDAKTVNIINIEGIFGDSVSSELGVNFSGVDDVFKTSTDIADIHAFIDTVDDALENVQTKRTNIGAIQNRLDSAAASLTTTIENLTSSKSTIMDADIAAESTEYINAQILQQAAGALLVQANQSPQIALSLI